MADHERYQKSVERRLCINQKGSCLPGVQASPARKAGQLVDERFAKVEKSLDRVAQRSAEPCRFGAVFASLALCARQQEQAAFALGVKKRKQLADESHAPLAKPIAFRV